MLPLAVQMYTVRDFTRDEKGLAETLDRIREIGYTAVQLSAVRAMEGQNPEVDAARARKLLDGAGLRCIGTHRDWTRLSQSAAAEIEFHRILDCDFTAIGSMPASFGQPTAESFRRFVDEAAPVAAALGEAGIRFGYHNHAFEFMLSGEGVSTLYDVLVDANDPNDPNLMLELDVYWAVHAGVNPVRLLERSHGRVPLIHLKDKEISPEGEPVMAPIGEGNLDWSSILPACRAAGVESYAVEQDVCRRDPFDCLRSSFVYLSNLPE